MYLHHITSCVGIPTQRQVEEPPTDPTSQANAVCSAEVSGCDVLSLDSTPSSHRVYGEASARSLLFALTDVVATLLKQLLNKHVGLNQIKVSEARWPQASVGHGTHLVSTQHLLMSGASTWSLVAGEHLPGHPTTTPEHKPLLASHGKWQAMILRIACTTSC